MKRPLDLSRTPVVNFHSGWPTPVPSNMDHRSITYSSNYSSNDGAHMHRSVPVSEESRSAQLFPSNDRNNATIEIEKNEHASKSTNDSSIKKRTKSCANQSALKSHRGILKTSKQNKDSTVNKSMASLKKNVKNSASITVRSNGENSLLLLLANAAGSLDDHETKSSSTESDSALPNHHVRKSSTKKSQSTHSNDDPYMLQSNDFFCKTHQHGNSHNFGPPSISSNDSKVGSMSSDFHSNHEPLHMTHQMRDFSVMSDTPTSSTNESTRMIDQFCSPCGSISSKTHNLPNNELCRVTHPENKYHKLKSYNTHNFSSTDLLNEVEVSRYGEKNLSLPGYYRSIKEEGERLERVRCSQLIQMQSKEQLQHMVHRDTMTHYHHHIAKVTEKSSQHFSDKQGENEVGEYSTSSAHASLNIEYPLQKHKSKSKKYSSLKCEQRSEGGSLYPLQSRYISTSQPMLYQPRESWAKMSEDRNRQHAPPNTGYCIRNEGLPAHSMIVSAPDQGAIAPRKEGYQSTSTGTSMSNQLHTYVPVPMYTISHPSHAFQFSHVPNQQWCFQGQSMYSTIYAHQFSGQPYQSLVALPVDGNFEGASKAPPSLRFSHVGRKSDSSKSELPSSP